MNFDYYYSQAGLDSGDITDLWRYNASTGSGAMPFPKTLNVRADENYSIYFTYEKLDNKRSSLFSNVNSGNGFCLGISDNNNLFLEAWNSGIKDYYLYNIPLAKKNTLALKKNGSLFSLVDYDLISNKIAYKDSYFVNPSIIFNTGNIKVGDTGYYETGFLNDFSGNFDQLAAMSEIYNTRDELTIFKGFRPESDYIESYYRNQSYSEDYVNWTDSIQISNDDYAYFKDYYYDLDLFLSTTTGQYLGSITASNSGVYWIASGYFAATVDGCTASGSSRFYSYTGLLAPTGFISFSDSVSTNYDSVNQYTNHRLFTNFSGYGPNVGLNHYLHKVWQSGYEYISSGTIDSGYYDSFRMDGISTLVNTDSIILAHVSGKEPVNFNTETTQDYVYGGFLINSENSGVSRFFVDGTEDLSFTTGDSKIYNSIAGTKGIYDSYNIYTPLYFSLNSYASGKFYKKSSIVFSGNNSFSQIYRNGLNTDYEELSEYSLYFNKNITRDVEKSYSYNNYSDFWTAL